MAALQQDSKYKASSRIHILIAYQIQEVCVPSLHTLWFPSAYLDRLVVQVEAEQDPLVERLLWLLRGIDVNVLLYMEVQCVCVGEGGGRGGEGGVYVFHTPMCSSGKDPNL